MTVRFRSTGQEVRFPKNMTAAEREEIHGPDPRTVREQAMNEIVRKREAEVINREERAHDEAVKHFDQRYGDVSSDPYLRAQVLHLRQQAINEAAVNRQVVDWGSKYPEIGEKVRQMAGLPSGQQQQRDEYFAERLAAQPGADGTPRKG